MAHPLLNSSERTKSLESWNYTEYECDSPSTEAPELGVNELFQITMGIKQSLTVPNTNFLRCVDEQRDRARSSLALLQTASSSALFVKALLDSDFAKSKKSTTNDIEGLDLARPVDPAEQEKFEHKIQRFVVQETCENSLETLRFLQIRGCRTPEVASAILNGEKPISNTSLVIGRGSFGVIRQSKINGSPYAAKHLECSDKISSDLLTSESSIQLACEHPHILKLSLVDQEEKTLYLEFAAFGDFKSYLSNASNAALTPQQLSKILYQISSGLAYIHKLGYIHRDIKLNNILLTDALDAKISDFGSAIAIEKFDPNVLAGTTLYLPVEYLIAKTSKEHCPKIDVWSFGFLIWDLLKKEGYQTPFIFQKQDSSEEKPFHFQTEMEFIYTVGSHFTGFKEGDLEKSLDPLKCKRYDPNKALLDIMKRCLIYKPEERPSMEEIKFFLVAYDLLMFLEKID